MRVTLTEAAAQDFDSLPLVIKLRTTRALERLERWPAVSGAKPLRGALVGQYRLRTGDWRIRFCVRDDRLIVLRIGHRDGFYEDER